MGQGMTKQQKQICATQCSTSSTNQISGKPYGRNSNPVKNVTSAAHLRHPIATLSVNYIEGDCTD